MPSRRTTEPGFWKSPVSSSLVASQSVELSEVWIDDDDTYWLEMRPDEGGRHVLVRRGSRSNVDMVNRPFDVGTRVYEYGGGSYAVDEGTVYFSNFRDMAIYQLRKGRSIERIAGSTGVRYGDFAVDRARRRLVCICEDHTGRVVNNAIVALSVSDKQARTLVSGSDFYLAPRVSPDGTRLAWISWNFPKMPWDGTELWLATIEEDGEIGKKTKVAGGEDESVVQPEFSPDGKLFFISDRSGWWNIYSYADGAIESLHNMDAEFAEPQWHLGLSSYGIGPKNVVSMYIEKGLYHVASIDLESRELRKFDLPFTEISSVRVANERAVFCGSSPSLPHSIVSLEIESGRWKILRRSSNLAIGRGYLSPPQVIEFPTERGMTAFALYYPPKNKDHKIARGEAPPLLVKVHGGPTHAAIASFDPQIQFFTSRGFGVVDVNYGGSTGQGRKYRERLNRMWGRVDVEDCLNAAKYLCSIKKADPDKAFIRGGSAGGYTTLASLAFTKGYRAGACYYGISDLEAWAKDTHKFESRYLDIIIGPYPAKRDLYRERSPVHSVNAVTAPLILFQGLDDKVVPPSQSRMMMEAMKKKGKEVALTEFKGEGHGFHQSGHIKRAIERELALYTRVLSASSIR